MTTIYSIAISLLVPILKWFFDKKSKKKLSDEEFITTMLEHHGQRANAGQAALDWKASLAKIKAEIAKKKE